jgi:micrococcal nuclease
MKFLKNKIVSIPLGIIMFIILLGISLRLAGILFVVGSLGLGIYLYTKSEKFKSWNKGVKGLITAGLVFILLIGIGLFNTNPQTAEQQKLEAEKTKIEQQQKDEAAKKAKEPKKSEDIKKAEEAKNQAVEQGKSNALAKFNLREVTVSRVVDGDTVELSDGNKVRFIGVNTPESTTKIEPYGKEASDYSKGQLTGKTVYIEKDVSETDRYSRLLRYVWLDIPKEITDIEIRAKMYNANLLLNGYAEQSTYPPDVKYAEYFKNYASEARSASKGVWAISPSGTTKGDTDKVGSSGSSGSNSSSNSTDSNSGGSVGQSNGSSTNLGTVYFTPSGKSYHSTQSCKTLSRSKTILSGSVQNAINSGHGDPCDVCVH